MNRPRYVQLELTDWSCRVALLKEPTKVRTIRAHRLDQNLNRALLKEPVKVRTVRGQM